MPSRDDRPPSLCSERMKICQQHLSKVYSRSKKLLVSARAGKVVPAVTGSAARGYTGEGTYSSGHGGGLSKFEKEKLSPYLRAVSGLFDGPSLLKQFQLKRLRTALADKNFKQHSQPDCPQSCCGGTSDPVYGQTLFGPDHPNTIFSSKGASDIDPFTKPREVLQRRTSRGDDEGIAAAVRSNVLRDDFTPETSKLLDRHQNSPASTALSVSREEEPLDGQLDSTRLLQGRNGGNSLFLPNNFTTEEPGRWTYRPILSNSSSDQTAPPLVPHPPASSPSYQKLRGRSSLYRMDDSSISNRLYLLPSEAHQTAVSTSTAKDSTQQLRITDSQHTASSTRYKGNAHQLNSQPRASSIKYDGKRQHLMADPSQKPYSTKHDSYQRDGPLSNDRRSLQLTEDMEMQHRAISLANDRSLQLMADMETQDTAISLANDRKSLESMADMESPPREVSHSNGKNLLTHRSSGNRNSSQITQDSDLQGPGEVATVSGRNHRQSSLGSRHRKSSRRSSGHSSQIIPGDSQQQAAPSYTGRPPPEALPSGDSRHREVSIQNGRRSSQRLPRAHTQQKSVGDTDGRNASQNSQKATDPQQAAVSPSDGKLPRVPPVAKYLQPGADAATSSLSLAAGGDFRRPRAAVTTESERMTFSEMLPSKDARQQRQKGGAGDAQPRSFASRLNKKVSKSSNVLQASVANYFGPPAEKSKALHTLTVSQLHDAICDHSTPDCPSFKREKAGSRPEISDSALLKPLQPGEEQDLPQADASGGAGDAAGQPTDAETGDGLEISRQEIVGANEKCAQYAFEVRADMRRQEKSSSSLWKYGSMAICTDNPARDYATGESPPDAWEILAKKKVEISGIHWSKSGSRRVVSHVCQILRQHKWGQGAVERLNAVKGIVHSHCVNAVLQQQTDPNLCLSFFNWAKRQKGYRHDVFAFTTMINILGRARNLKGVRRLLEDMHTGGVEPSVATYNTLILCYGKVDSLNESLRVFRIMQEAGCKPDNVTYSILIHLCIKAGYLQEALKLYQNMREAGVQPDTISYSIVIDTIGRTGNLSEARKLFSEMRERGYVPNEFTYNSLIDRHAKARKTQHALKFYTEMRAAGFKLNKVTCTIMMGVLSSLGKYDKAEALFSEMQQLGIVADTAVYSLMVNMWGNAGDLDKAVSWYGRMLGNLVTPSLSTFSSLVNAHLEANLYQAAQHFLTSMGMWGIASDLKLYTILLRHCTVCEKQEHADAVLGIMDRLGHPAHRFLYELLTAKTQDKQAVTARVEAYLETVDQEDHNNLQGFLNALIEFLHKLQCKTDPGHVWEIATERGIFPSTIVRREAPNHWLVDLHSLSVGTALVALPRLLATLRDSWAKNPTKRVYIVTGWGKRSRVAGTSALKQAVSEVLDGTRSPFAPDQANAGVFVSYGPPFCDWISHPSIMKKLGELTAKANL